MISVKMVNYLTNLKKCEEIKDDSEREICIFKLLKEVAEVQDKIQLKIPKTDEGIALSQQIINSANGIIIEIAKNNGNLVDCRQKGYLDKTIGLFNNNCKRLREEY